MILLDFNTAFELNDQFKHFTLNVYRGEEIVKVKHIFSETKTAAYLYKRWLNQQCKDYNIGTQLKELNEVSNEIYSAVQVLALYKEMGEKAIPNLSEFDFEKVIF